MSVLNYDVIYHTCEQHVQGLGVLSQPGGEINLCMRSVMITDDAKWPEVLMQQLGINPCGPGGRGLTLACGQVISNDYEK